MAWGCPPPGAKALTDLFFLSQDSALKFSANNLWFLVNPAVILH